MFLYLSGHCLARERRHDELAASISAAILIWANKVLELHRSKLIVVRAPGHWLIESVVIVVLSGWTKLALMATDAASIIVRGAENLVLIETKHFAPIGLRFCSVIFLVKQSVAVTRSYTCVSVGTNVLDVRLLWAILILIDVNLNFYVAFFLIDDSLVCFQFKFVTVCGKGQLRLYSEVNAGQHSDRFGKKC